MHHNARAEGPHLRCRSGSLAPEEGQTRIPWCMAVRAPQDFLKATMPSTLRHGVSSKYYQLNHVEDLTWRSIVLITCLVTVVITQLYVG